jgi:hypothetical protein
LLTFSVDGAEAAMIQQACKLHWKKSIHQDTIIFQINGVLGRPFLQMIQAGLESKGQVQEFRRVHITGKIIRC